MQKVIKKIIVILLLLLMLLIVFTIIIKVSNNSNKNDYSKDSEGIEPAKEEKQKLECENDKKIYYTLQLIANKFIQAASYGENETIICMLDDQYKKEYNINENNILDIMNMSELTNFKQRYSYTVERIYSQKNGNISTHLIYGYYKNSVDNEEKEFNMLIELDLINKTFNIYLERLYTRHEI